MSSSAQICWADLAQEESAEILKGKLKDRISMFINMFTVL